MLETVKQVNIFKNNRENSFYVYVHRRLSDNKPFYVGKGNRYRAWVSKGRNDWWNAVVSKHGYSVEIIFDNLTNEEALACEKDAISEFRYFNFPLVNLTSGGEGCTVSEEARKKMSKAKQGVYSGLKNPFADKHIYVFYHNQTDTTEICTRSDLCEKYKVPADQLKKLFYAKPRKTVYGWALKGEYGGKEADS